MKFTLFAAFLFSVWMSFVVAVGDNPPVSCCLAVSKTRIPAKDIVHYNKQDAVLCPVVAVRFHTKEDKVICSDPDSNWAKKVMDIVDRRKTTKPSPKPTKCYTSTTNVIPTTATTDKISGTETETSTSTTVPTTVTTMKTSTLETEISKTTILPTSVSTDNPESTAITCGIDEPTAPPTVTTRETPGIGAVTRLTTFTAMDITVITTTHHNRHNRTKPSKLKIKLLGKRKKGLRKYQMRINHLKNKSR